MSLATNGHYLPKRTEGSLSGLFGLNDKPASYAIDLQIDKTVGFDSTAIKHPTWPKLDINSCNVRVEAERFAKQKVEHQPRRYKICVRNGAKQCLENGVLAWLSPTVENA